ncbi:MAG: DUF5686 family protein, partial [Bacteroidota bacterium]
MDSLGEPLPYVSVLIAGTSIGTTTNLNGDYSLQVAQGLRMITFSMIGYAQRTETIEVGDSDIRFDVHLIPATYRLSEVVVSTGEEDPANTIIRNTRDRREIFRKEIKAYSCESYVKSTQRLVRFPKKFMGQKVDIGELVDSVTKIFYLSESVSRIDWQEPDKVKEQMISSKVSGNPRAYSFNRGADLVNFNVYESLLKLGNLVPRGIVSPIADNCFMYYRYKLEGAFMENGKLVNKIKVIPKRPGDPVFSGDLYIVDDDWRVHGFDLLLTKEQQLQFVDTFNIRQAAVQLEGGAWMPFSNALYFHFSIFGFEGTGDIIGVFKDYDTHPVFPKNHFNGEILSVDTGSNRRDTAYWEKMRPVPLTPEEAIDYNRKDS